MISELTPDVVRRAFCAHFTEAVSLQHVNGELVMLLPQTDAYGDSLVLYIAERNGVLELSDGGFVHHELAAHAGNPPASAELWDRVRGAANRHGVAFDGGELCAGVATTDGIAEAALALSQGMLDAMAFARHNSPSLIVQFVEEVDLFFRDHKLTYEAKPAIKGRSGATHRPDFAVYNGSRHLVQAIGSENSMRKSLNTIYDVTERDHSAKFVSFIDAERGDYSNATYQQLEYKSKVFEWEKRNLFVDYWASLH